MKVEFANSETRIFDATHFLNKGVFTELKNENYFSQVKIAFDCVEWPNERDFSKGTLYLLGTPA